MNCFLSGQIKLFHTRNKVTYTSQAVYYTLLKDHLVSKQSLITLNSQNHTVYVENTKSENEQKIIC